MRAEDALPDHLDTATFGGVVVRKGTIAAFIANAQICTDPAASAESRAAAERDIVESLPALRAIGLFHVMAVRDARVRAVVESDPADQRNAAHSSDTPETAMSVSISDR